MHRNSSGSWTSVPSSREVTVVEIRNPITQQKKNGRKFTDFEIWLKSNSKAFTLPKSTVRRRYSDFVWLRTWLSENNEGFSSIRKTPTLPPKKIIGRFEENFIQDRMKGLQRFLRKVIEHNVFLSDKALHLFLQSNLNIKQIENYLTGKPVDGNDSMNADSVMDDIGNIRDNDSKDINKGRTTLDSVSSLQRISEDSESRTSVSSEAEVVRNGATQNEATTNEALISNSPKEAPGMFEYESLSSLPHAKIDGRLNDETGGNGSSSSEFSSGYFVSTTDLSNFEQQDESKAKEQQTIENEQGLLEGSQNVECPASKTDNFENKAADVCKGDIGQLLPGLQNKNLSTDSGTGSSEEEFEAISDIGDTNSSFGIIGSQSTNSPMVSPSEESPLACSCDLTERGFIAAVPIKHSL